MPLRAGDRARQPGAIVIRIVSRQRRWFVASLVGASIAQAALAVLAAWCIQHVFDGVIAGADGARLDGFAGVAAIFLGAALAGGALEIYRAWAGEHIGTAYVAELREALYQRLINATPEAIGERRAGGLLLPFIGDLTAIKKWVSDGLVRLISAAAMGLILLGALATRSIAIAAAAAAVVAIFGAALLWMNSALSQAIREARTRRGAVANFVASSLRAASTIQLFGKLPRELKRLRRRNDSLMKANLRLVRVTGAMSAISHLAALALIAVILAIGVVEVRDGAMTAGSIAAAMSFAGLLAGVIRDLGVSFELARRAEAAFARTSRALQLPTLVRTSGSRRKRKDAQPGLELRNVSIAGALEGASANARPGAIMEIVGDSGSGKSSLIAAIAGMRSIDGGRILLDGRDLSRTRSSWLRRRIGLAAPTVPLLRGTLGMNLRYRMPKADAAEIDRVIAGCHLGPVVARLADGLATRLADGAPELSKSEIARVQIARAILGTPDLLLLDEVDMHLDPVAAETIADTLRDYPGIVLLTASSEAFQKLTQSSWRIEGGRLQAVQRPASCIGAPGAAALSAPAALTTSLS